MTFFIFHRQSLPSWSCRFNPQLVQLVGRFWVLFLSHTGLGFQLWLYSHLCMWVVHWGLLLRLPWSTWVCPCGARCGGGAAAWVAGALAAPGSQGIWRLGQQEIQCSRRVCQPALASALQCSFLENPPSLTEKPGRPQSTGSRRVGHNWSNPVHIETRLFSCVTPAPVRFKREGGPAARLVGTLAVPSAQTRTVSALRVMIQSESFFGSQKASLARLSP